MTVSGVKPLKAQNHEFGEKFSDPDYAKMVTEAREDMMGGELSVEAYMFLYEMKDLYLAKPGMGRLSVEELWSKAYAMDEPED